MTRRKISNRSELVAAIEQADDLSRAVFQSLDLRGLEDLLATPRLRDNLLLGCKTSTKVLAQFEHPIVFPELPDLPFSAYRSSLYTPTELLGDYVIGDHDSYSRTVDGATYQHYMETGGRQANDVLVTLCRRLHDHAIADEVQEFITGKKVVAIMGGHSLARDDPDYLTVARIARDLAKLGFLMTSGGGPGAMEATHLGVWFALRPDSDLLAAIDLLAQIPKYHSIGPWLDGAATVARDFPLDSTAGIESLGIPTWAYGHEPPTCFATHIAKFFANSVREEGLLAIALHGVIFAPGSAGTIQEIFQDAAQNHYRSYGHPSPMIFLNEHYWTNVKPVYPVLKQLAASEDYGSLLTVSDCRRTIVQNIANHAADRESTKPHQA